MYETSGRKPIEVGGSLWGKTEIESKSQTESVAQILHSTADNLAQIINKSLLSGRYPIDKVYLKVIKNDLKIIDTNIFNEVESLLTSDEFKYIDAFVNTIKHQKIVDHNWKVDSKRPFSQNAIQFKGFDYKGNTYPAMWSDEIIGPIRGKIIDLILNIGNSMNNYLRNIQ
ncbi:MAG: hypothetical protein NTW30_04080 [Candidatus Aenigmarchaeota archaeon]|nr:hypothetical protein [Candidatus Aenigmarchaeota archaeon]